MEPDEWEPTEQEWEEIKEEALDEAFPIVEGWVNEKAIGLLP